MKRAGKKSKWDSKSPGFSLTEFAGYITERSLGGPFMIMG
jgi:hypothetical protein